MKIAFIVVVLGLVSIAAAQTTQPARKSTGEYWMLKPGAPKAIENWFNDQPRYRQDNVAAVARKLDKAKAERDQLRAAGSAPRSTAGGGSRRGSRVGARPVDTTNQRMADLEKKAKEIQQIEAELADAKADNRSLVVPTLVRKVDSYGKIIATLTVDQILGPNEAIVTYGGESIWLKGIDTTKTADDHKLGVSFNVLISGTKSYDTVLGAKRTILLAEPCDHLQWIERTGEMPPIPIPTN